jgi:hypothetical protein
MRCRKADLLRHVLAQQVGRVTDTMIALPFSRSRFVCVDKLISSLSLAWTTLFLKCQEIAKNSSPASLCSSLRRGASDYHIDALLMFLKTHCSPFEYQHMQRRPNTS